MSTNLIFADPPGRVARISYLTGAVSFMPAGQTDWVNAKKNHPLTTGDRIWADKDARVELQIGAAVLRLARDTSVSLVNLNNKTAQFQLSEGTVNLRVWRLKQAQVYEIDTPNLAFSVHKPGSYRINVQSDGKVTVVDVMDGHGSVYGEKVGYQVEKGQSCSFSGTDLKNYQCSKIPQPDDFDRWVAARDHRTKTAKSTRYVSQDMIGHEDLDDYGNWRHVEGYGDAWMPNDMPPGWAPYSTGYWAWVDPWGWTWIDESPWGFAPYHYGRWVYFEDHWYWVPGPIIQEPVYAPAFVVFFGNGFDIEVDGGGVGWFPLGYGEVFIPSYEVSQEYFGYINTSNAYVNHNFVYSVFKNRNLVMPYRNQHVPNAVTAVPTSIFQKSQPIAPHKVVVTPAMINNAKVVPTAKVTPVVSSIIGTGQQAIIKPPKAVITRPVVVKTPPPAPPVPFADMQKKLADNPGKPLAPQEMNSLRPATVPMTPQIKVITPPVHPVMPIAPGKISKPVLPAHEIPAAGPKLKPIPPGELKPFVPHHEIGPVAPPHHDVRPIAPPPQQFRPVPPPHQDVRPVAPPPQQFRPVPPPHQDVRPIAPPPQQFRPVPPPHQDVRPVAPPPQQFRPVPPPHQDVRPIAPPPHAVQPMLPPKEMIEQERIKEHK